MSYARELGARISSEISGRTAQSIAVDNTLHTIVVRLCLNDQREFSADVLQFSKHLCLDYVDKSHHRIIHVRVCGFVQVRETRYGVYRFSAEWHVQDSISTARY